MVSELRSLIPCTLGVANQLVKTAFLIAGCKTGEGVCPAPVYAGTFILTDDNELILVLDEKPKGLGETKRNPIRVS